MLKKLIPALFILITPAAFAEFCYMEVNFINNSKGGHGDFELTRSSQFDGSVLLSERVSPGNRKNFRDYNTFCDSFKHTLSAARFSIGMGAGYIPCTPVGQVFENNRIDAILSNDSDGKLQCSITASPLK